VIVFLGSAEPDTWPNTPSANDAGQWSEKEKLCQATALASVGLSGATADVQNGSALPFHA
jgi:hypothetical protein